MSASRGASAMSCSPAALPSAAAIQRIRDGGARVVCFAPALVIAQQAGAHGRRCDRHRGQRGRRPYRPGLDRGAGAGGLAAHQRGAGLRRRRHRPRRGDPVLSRNGRGRGAARHPLRLRPRIDRASAFQARLHPRLGARCGAVGAARRALSGDPGARPRQPGDRAVPRGAARRSSTGSTTASCRKRRRSSRSSISGPARCAARSSTAMSKPAR